MMDQRRSLRAHPVVCVALLVTLLTVASASGAASSGDSSTPDAIAPDGASTGHMNQAAAEVTGDTAYGVEARAALGAHHMCSGLWVVGRGLRRSPREVRDSDIAPFAVFGWDEGFTFTINQTGRRVTARGPGAPARTAIYNGDQGCAILPRAALGVHFDPVAVPRDLPPASEQAWPMGDLGAMEPVPDGVDIGGVTAALDWAMGRTEYNTRAIVVVHGGKIVGERYAPGWSAAVPQIGWSQGKSITAALIGVLVQQGELTPDEPAPIAEWQEPGDPRAEIRVVDLLRMSSGLDFANLGLAGPQSYTRANEHMRIYFDALNVFEHAVQQPLELPPNTAWRYRNSDPLVLGKIVRDTVEARGEEYLTFPQRALFDRIGARSFVLETDAWGNFIMTGYDYGGARDWARFGMLHLQDGIWEGDRILPEGWTELIATPAPADENRGYGGLFWLNRGGAMDRVPEDAYWAAGFMGQTTMVVPSRDVVVVRLGPSPQGSDRLMNELVGRLLEAIARP